MSNSKIIGWSIWLVASMFYAYQYIIRVMPSIMMPEIMDHFNINAITFGQFSGVYYIGYSLAHLPIGLALDRYGMKKVLPICILLTIVGVLPMIFSDHWIYPIIGRFLVGIGSSGAILGIFKIVRMVFEEAKFARMLSFAVSIGLIGAIYGGGPVNYMYEQLGSKDVIIIFSVIGIILANVTYLLASDERTHTTSVIADMKNVLLNPRVMLVSALAGMMVGPLEGFADIWGPQFLAKVYGFESTISASLPSMIFIGMCFGAPVLSFIAEKISYLGAIVTAGLVMTSTFFAMVLLPLSPEVITVTLVITGICCAYQIMAIYIAGSYAGDSVGLATAVANMIIMIFGWFFHSTIGYVVEIFGGRESAEALKYGVGVIPIAMLFGVVGFVYVALTRKKERLK